MQQLTCPPLASCGEWLYTCSRKIGAEKAGASYWVEAIHSQMSGFNQAVQVQGQEDQQVLQYEAQKWEWEEEEEFG